MIGGLATVPASADGPPIFEQHVRPILKAHCFQCHGEEGKPKGGLDLRLVRRMIEGGDSGPAIVPGKHEESLLWEQIDRDEMPPGEKKLSAAREGDPRRWIDGGATTARPEPETLAAGVVITDEDRRSGRSSRSAGPPSPRVRDRGGCPDADRRLPARRLEAKGLGFAPEADRRTLIRRADVRPDRACRRRPRRSTRSWPTTAPDAYERLVDRLLAVARLRRALGPALARRGRLRRLRGRTRPRTRCGRTPEVPRLRHPVVQRRQALRPSSSASSSPATSWSRRRTRTSPAADRRRADRHRLPPDGPRRHRRAGGRPEDRPQRGGRRHGQDRLDLAPGPDGRLRPVPRPPLRPDPAGRLLPPPGGLRAGPRRRRSWRPPAQRLVSLWTDADRQKAAEVEAEVKKIENARADGVAGTLVESTFEKELAEAARGPARRRPRGPRARPAASGPTSRRSCCRSTRGVNVTRRERLPVRREGPRRAEERLAAAVAEARKAPAGRGFRPGADRGAGPGAGHARSSTAATRSSRSRRSRPAS